MPRPKINDYIIYKIECNDESVTDVYVGSTANFHKRKNKHKNASFAILEAPTKGTL
mgnify:CR=1 FL=1